MMGWVNRYIADACECFFVPNGCRFIHVQEMDKLPFFAHSVIVMHFNAVFPDEDDTKQGRAATEKQGENKAIEVSLQTAGPKCKT